MTSSLILTEHEVGVWKAWRPEVDAVDPVRGESCHTTQLILPNGQGNGSLSQRMCVMGMDQLVMRTLPPATIATT